MNGNRQGSSGKVIPMIGRQLGKYTLESKLGSGGMATVYAATHATLGNKVAVKVLHEHLADQPAFRERFLREAQAAASLSHTGVTQVFDVDDEDGVCYIAMEYLEGESLHDHLAGRLEDGPIAVEEAVRVVEAVGESLAYAHQRGIVHRDIKPANVMITSEGRVVLADFGLAAVMDQTRLTVEGATAGTPSYMSPEQVRGEQGDGRSDIYSLGVMLYQLVSGDLPFQSETLAGMLQGHLEKCPPPLAEKISALPDGVLRTTEIALRKQPQERFQTVEEMLACLRGDAATDPQLAATQVVQTDMAATTAMSAATPSAPDATASAGGAPRGVGYLAVAVLAVVAGVWLWQGLGTDVDSETVPGGAEETPSMASDATPSMASDGVDSMAVMTGWDDEFEANTHGWEETTGDVRRTVGGGAYEVEINVADRAIAALARDGGKYLDLEWTVTAELVAGGEATGYGMVFRYVDPQNYRVFGVNGLGEWSVWAMEQGSWRELRGEATPWTPHPAIRIGSRNFLDVIAEGERLSLRVNGEEVGAATDPSPETGLVGFYVASPQLGATAESLVRFEDATVARR
ncbi:MAG: protein kinase [Acidobacteria bacterium]|nr:protein kinase [Acidobacteriota bacterium]